MRAPHRARALLGARTQLIGMTTRLSNHIRGVLKTFGVLPECDDNYDSCEAASEKGALCAVEGSLFSFVNDSLVDAVAHSSLECDMLWQFSVSFGSL
jgi:hypothetical protein